MANRRCGMTLGEAVTGVRDDVLAGEALSDALAFFAKEAEVNPVLLERKVRESFGDDISSLKTDLLDRQSQNRDVALRRAKKGLLAYPGGDISLLGALFVWRGEEHVFMTDHPRPIGYPIKAVRVRDCALKLLTRAEWEWLNVAEPVTGP